MTQPDDATSMPISDRMQALLARAAEDQLSEQRQLADALTELRGQMQQITNELTSIREDAGRSDRVDSAVGAVSAEVREAVRLIGERLDGLARMVHQRGLDLAELRGSFAELRTTVATHGESLSGLTGGLDSLPSYGERVAALQETVSALSDRLTGLDDVRSAVADVDARVGTTADALAQLRSGLDAVRQRTESLPAASDLESTSSQVAELSRRIEELSGSTAPLADRLSAMQQSIGLETERNGRLADQLAQVADRIEEAAGNAAAAREDSGALARRLDALQEDVTAIGGNVAGLVESGPDPAELAAALDAARAAGDQTGRVNEIAVQVAEMRAALLGDEGLESQFAALSQRVADLGQDSGSGLDQHTHEAISDAVAREMAASEQRLSAHLDEAVLALAEVLLRRRPGRAGSAVSASFTEFWTEAEAEPSDTDAELTAEDDVEEDIDAEGAAEGAEAPHADAPGWLEDDEEQPEPDDVPAPWDRAAAAEPAEPEAEEASHAQTGAAVPVAAAPEPGGPVAAPGGEWAGTVRTDVTAEPKRKRRPWWRPGD